jgi:phenylalanyl-tRNA synthetase beta chain
VTLDGEERELEPSMLMIADGEGVVALAGIMGGADSEIHNGTNDVLLESAHFDALSVRRTARRLGLHTEASHRFERGTDPEMAAAACDRAAALIAELAGGRVCRGRIDVYPRLWQPRHMEFSVGALSAFTGLDIQTQSVVEILGGLEFGPEVENDLVRVTVPPHRVDIDRVPDLYEEVIRHVGYDAVPSRLPVLPTTPGHRHPNWELVDRAREAAVAAGLIEIMTWSFIDPEIDGLVASHALCPGEPVTLDNPLASTQAAMRRSLLPGMLAAAKANLNQGERTLEIFEQGRVFNFGSAGPQEQERLGIVLCDEEGDDETRFRRLKGIVEFVGDRVGLPAFEWHRGGEPWFDGRAGAVVETDDGRRIGVAGLVSRDYAARWDLGTVAAAELDIDVVTEPALARFEALARFPSVVMDMTVEHGEDLSYAELESATRDLAGDWVEDLSYVTRFLVRDGSGRVRTTQRLVYRHPDRSLTQDEVNEAHSNLRDRLAARLDITFA